MRRITTRAPACACRCPGTKNSPTSTLFRMSGIERIVAFAFCVLACGVHAQTPSDLVARALAYEHGEGVPKDQIKAAALYCDAARAGDAEAAFSLGWMYTNGRGVAHDDAIAAALFAHAARKGH